MNNKIKQWKYCWYLDFFIMFGLFDSENLCFILIFERKYDKVLTFDIVHFPYFEISASLLLAPPSNQRRTLLFQSLISACRGALIKGNTEHGIFCRCSMAIQVTTLCRFTMACWWKSINQELKKNKAWNRTVWNIMVKVY